MIPIGDEDDLLFFPYNSVEDENGDPDRLYDSQDFADYFKQFIGNGVYPNPSNGLLVESLKASRILTVRLGSSFVDGRFYLQKKDFDFSIDVPHPTLNRKDIVICRHDNITRTSQVFYVAGVASATPLAPSIVRNDDIFDLKLCEIFVPANASAITPSNITDTRLDKTVCGIVTGVIDQVDTTYLFQQYQDYLGQKIYDWEALFNEIVDYQEQKRIELAELIALLETQSFTLVNNQFDDTSTKRGCTYTSVFVGGIKQEEIRVSLNNMLLAERETQFVNNERIVNINFYPWEVIEGNNTIKTTTFTMTEKTKFVNGVKITEVI